MSMCKTGCGTQTSMDVCDVCWGVWMTSPEEKRATEQYNLALADFVNRIRAERQNGGTK